MWTYNDSGYLVYLENKPAIGKCRSCGTTFIRKVIPMSYTDKAHEDRCPNCHGLIGTDMAFYFDNRLLGDTDDIDDLYFMREEIAV